GCVLLFPTRRSSDLSVLGETEKMAGLLSQLLMLARADKSHKKLNLETVDLSGLAAAVAEQQQENAGARGIAIQTEIEPGLVLQGDRESTRLNCSHVS